MKTTTIQTKYWEGFFEKHPEQRPFWTEEYLEKNKTNPNPKEKMKESKQLIKFELTEQQYEIVKDSLRAAQVLLREESEQAARTTAMSGGTEERNKASHMRILSTQYDNNWKVQQLMTDQFFAGHNINQNA